MAGVPRDALVLALIKLYERAERELLALLGAAIARGAKGTARFYELQHQRVQAHLARLARSSEPLERALGAAAHHSGVMAVNRTLDVREAFTGAPTRSAEAFASSIATDLRRARSEVGRQADDIFRRVGLEETARGTLTGRTIPQTAMAIRAELQRQGVTAFTDRAGKRWRLSTYAMMVARTTSREAASVGTLERMSELGRDLVSVDEHPTSCPICRPYQGKTYSISGDTEGYPRLAPPLPPPIHPNCRHVLYPARVSFVRFARELGVQIATSKVAA